jgi:hypothetical protein
MAIMRGKKSLPKGYKPKSKEVRDRMQNSDNYVLEYYKTNRSKGAILGQTEKYLPPLK